MDQLLVGIIAGVAATVIGALVLDLIRDRWTERIRIRRITRVSEEPVEALLKLYERMFRDRDQNYDIAEVRSFLDAHMKPPRHVPSVNITLVAMLKTTVLGFVACHYYRQRRMAIVSYFAVDDENPAAAGAGIALARGLRRRLALRGCRLVLYEVELKRRGGRKRLVDSEVSTVVRLYQLAANSGLKAYQLCFNYRCPPVSIRAEGKRDNQVVLVCVPVRGQLPSEVERATLEKYLRFIYLDCYGDLYPSGTPEFVSHQKQLEQALAELVATLPPKIPVNDGRPTSSTTWRGAA